MLSRLSHIGNWIFDLDNTLYPAKADLFGLIDVKMGEFIQGLLGCDPQEARRVQKRYFMEHGITLSGLMHHHGTDPHAFLDFVHDILLERISPDPELNADLRELPVRRLIFTHADEHYATRVLERMDLVYAFEFLPAITIAQ